MPICYMLVGVPGSGKTTWRKKHAQYINKMTVLSTDDYIDAMAKTHNTTYTDTFAKYIKQATVYMDRMLNEAIEDSRDIVWDQTNLTVNSRKQKLESIPKYYLKVAVVFPTPDGNELERRLNSRPDKIIPTNIMVSMINSFTMLSKDEGFDSIMMFDDPRFSED